MYGPDGRPSGSVTEDIKDPFFSDPENFRYFGQEIDYIGILDFFRLKTRQQIGPMKEELDGHFHIVAYIYT